MREKISALLDGELSEDERDELIRHISRDKELAEVWNRYHLYRAVFRDEPISYDPQLSRKIAGKLHMEASEWSTSEQSADDLATMHMPVTSAGKRPVLAIAASLVLATAIAVFSISYLPSETSLNDIAAVGPRTAWEMDREHEDRLNGFLVEHGEFTPASGMNGLTAYAKFVSYDSGPR